jgi:hypothetical protein
MSVGRQVESPIVVTRRRLRSVEVGAPRTAGPLTLVPLFGGAPAGDYLLAAEALAAGTLAIEEVGPGVVQELVVRNRGDLPVLLLGGEHLEGARQDRVPTVTVLAPPRRDTVIPVACVEQGRWGYEGPEDLAPAPHFAFSAVRARNVDAAARALRADLPVAADQSAVWAEVAARHRTLGGGPTRTGAMREDYDRHRNAVEKLLGALGEPEEGQTGVAAGAGGRVVAVDLFDRPRTLCALWPRLVPGYAMDALGQAPGAVDPRAVGRHLQQAAEPPMTAHPGVGLGTTVVLDRGSLVGEAQVWGRAVVHAAVLRRWHPSVPGGRFRPEAPIAGPARRARMAARSEGEDRRP